MTKIKVIQICKNLGIFLIKMLLISIIGYCLYIMFSNTYLDIKNEYRNYIEIRGIENYGEESSANLKSSDILNDEEKLYSFVYEVNNQEYTLKVIKPVDMVIDNTQNILYDKLEPELSVIKEDIKEIDSFYSNSFKNLGYLYIKSFISIIIFGVIWYSLDILKYSKKIWKIYV